MTLGICAVYMFEEAYLPLFRLQIDRLRQHTTGPFRIYGAVNRLPSGMRKVLATVPEVVQVTVEDCPPDLRGREEHALCQRRLAERALADGCDTVVMMHLDSFPIRDGWNMRARELLEHHAVVTVAPYCFSAGLFLRPETFGAGRALPSLLMTDAQRESPEGKRFFTEYPMLDSHDTGIGWLFLLWTEGRSWQEWRPHETGGQVYGSEMFHLVAGTRTGHPDGRPFRKGAAVQWLRRASQIVKPLLPRSVFRRLKEPFVEKTVLMPDGAKVDKRDEVQALLSDPDSYIAARQNPGGEAF